MPRMDAVTLKQLRALKAVAEAGSMTAAGAALGLTTPAIHSQIKGLEAAIGRGLLTRGGEGGGFVPTAEGVAMLKAAERVDAVLSQVTEELRALGAGRSGLVRLGTVSTAKYFAPRLVRMLNDACPEVEVRLQDGNREAVIADLDRGALDLAVMGRPPRAPLVEAVPLGPHPHGIVLPPGHRLAGKEGFDPAALMQEVFLSREPGSGTRILMERFLDRLAEGDPVQRIEMTSNETIKQAVMAGLGVAFLSLHTVCDELAAGRLVLLRGPGLPVMRHWYLVTPADHPPSAAARRVAEVIVALNGTYLPKPPPGQVPA